MVLVMCLGVVDIIDMLFVMLVGCVIGSCVVLFGVRLLFVCFSECVSVDVKLMLWVW